QRPARADGENQMGASDPPPPDLGLRGRQIHDRSHLVVLSFLGARLLATQTWTGSDEDWLTNYGDLRDLRCRQRCRRLAFVVADPAWKKRKHGPQNHDADLWALR